MLAQCRVILPPQTGGTAACHQRHRYRWHQGYTRQSSFHHSSLYHSSLIARLSDCNKIFGPAHEILVIITYTVNPVQKGYSQRSKFDFQDQLSLNAGQKYSLSYCLSLRSLFCLFLSGRLRHVLLYEQKPLSIVVC